MDATARVEGNGPTGCIVLAEYKRVISELEAHQDDSQEFPSLDKAINAMIDWLAKYQDEALESDCVILATILNPRFRVKFFTIHYPYYQSSANSAIEASYEKLVKETDSHEATPTPDQDEALTEADEFDVFQSCDVNSKKSSTSELEEYLQGRFPIGKGKSPLDWWKVGILNIFAPHFKLLMVTFPLLIDHRNTETISHYYQDWHVITYRYLPLLVRVNVHFQRLLIFVPPHEAL